MYLLEIIAMQLLNNFRCHPASICTEKLMICRKSVAAEALIDVEMTTEAFLVPETLRFDFWEPLAHVINRLIIASQHVRPHLLY